MAGLDDSAPNYGRAHRRWPDAPLLEKYYGALVASFGGDSHGMIEHVKACVECVCLTIIEELGGEKPPADPSTTQLLVAALTPLGLKNSRGASKLDKVLSGFNKLADALSDMRNANGPVAHGKDAFLDTLTEDHSRAFLYTGDAIIGVLLNALEGKQPDLNRTREPYESFPQLNERIDRAVSVVARIDDEGDRPVVVFSVSTGPEGESVELRVEPSRLLYGIDRSAYIEVLETASEVEEAEEIDSEVESTPLATAAGGEQDTPAEVPSATPTPISAPVVVAYAGRLESSRAEIEKWINSQGLLAKHTLGTGQLVDSLLKTIDENLALDWAEREPLLARLRVAAKRVMSQFGVERMEADKAANGLVAWCVQHLAGLRGASAEVQVTTTPQSAAGGSVGSL